MTKKSNRMCYYALQIVKTIFKSTIKSLYIENLVILKGEEKYRLKEKIYSLNDFLIRVQY